MACMGYVPGLQVLNMHYSGYSLLAVAGVAGVALREVL